MPNQAPPEPPKTELEEIQIQTNTVQNAVSRKKNLFQHLFKNERRLSHFSSK